MDDPEEESYDRIDNGLSQADCVVWDESNNVDLRDVDSPMVEGGSGALQDFSLLGDKISSSLVRASSNSTSMFRDDYAQETGNTIANESLSRKQKDHVKAGIHGPENDENLYGVVHARKKRRWRKHQDQEPNKTARRFSSGSSDGGNLGLANLLQQVATPSLDRTLATKSPVPQKNAPANTLLDAVPENAEEQPSLSVQRQQQQQQQQPRKELQFMSPTPATTGKSQQKQPRKELQFMSPKPASTGKSHAAIPSASVTQMTSSKEDEDDEYDSFDMSLEDLQKIDSMVVAATQDETQTQSQEASQNISSVSNGTLSRMPLQNLSLQSQKADEHKRVILPSDSTLKTPPPPPTATSTTMSTAATNTTATTHSMTDNDDDEFGDFPELDFAAISCIDQSIAERNMGTMTLEQNLAELSDEQLTNMVPPPHDIVKNPRRTSESADLTFTRYTVVQAREHAPSYTKIVSVAAWKESSQSDTESEEMVNVHAEGVIFLRGEWYHTQLSLGDVLHLCSLTGRFETRSCALPLVLHTTPPPGSDADDLLLVVNPDILLTPTTISDTVTCNRRAVLRNRIGSTGLTSSAPLFGTMRHELFQACLRQNDFTNSFIDTQIPTVIERSAEALLACDVTSREAEIEVKKAIPQMREFVKHFTKFGRKSFGSLSSGELERFGSYPAVNFLVDEVELVEDSLVSHELGLKGAVDVIVRGITSPCGNNNAKPTTSLVCIELKTGHMQRAHSAHMAQLALYTLMVHTRYGSTMPNEKNMGSGALLYINNENLHAVHISPFVSEIKSLIGQRNSLAIEQTRASTPRGVEAVTTNNSTSKRLIEPPPPAILPKVETAVNTCRRCYTNRECMMYATAEQASPQNLPNGKILDRYAELTTKITGHLSKEDFEYFNKWDRLIDIEADHSTLSAAECWLLPSLERERSTGKCIASLVVDSIEPPTTTCISSPAIIRLKRGSNSPSTTSLFALSFERGCHAVLSVDATSVSENYGARPHMHIVRGIVDSVNEQKISVRASLDDIERLERLMKTKKEQQRELCFRLDRDEVATGVGTLRQNLINLFAGSAKEGDDGSLKIRRSANIRKLVVSGELPRFKESIGLFETAQSSFDTPGCDLESLCLEFCELNSDQQAAVRNVMSCENYALVQGLPGTGKSSTIAFIIRLLLAHGKRVLVTSYTHSAVDNVLLKLIAAGVGERSEGQTPSLVRVAQKSSCHQNIVPYLATEISARMKEDNTHAGAHGGNVVENLKRVMASARVVGVSALSVPRAPLLARENFDFVIVDEAGQISQPAIIGALQAADKFVLVGDHKQLPPLVQSELADNGGYGESMLKRLAELHPSSVSQLSLQYRMASSICQLSNDIIYDGDLVCANEIVAAQKLKLTNDFSGRAETWLQRAIDPHKPVVFVNTDTIAPHNGPPRFLERKTSKGGSLVNDVEADLVKKLVLGFVEANVDLKTIGLICPFRAQIRLMEKDDEVGSWRKEGLELSTIDKYQGRDKDAIILSLVRSNEQGTVGRLLSDTRRLNVAVTRAKKKLIVVGSLMTLRKGSKALGKALDRIEQDGHVVAVRPNPN